MPAPIHRYSDPRLYGKVLVTPFNKSYEWIRTVAHPLHSKCNLIEECAVRALKVVTGVLAMALTALPALVGRGIQILHYHLLSEKARSNPAEVVVDGMHLPVLESCQEPQPIKYHGTTQEAAIGILRWGFDPARSALSSKMAEAVYVSAKDTVSAAYGGDQLILDLDLKKEEIAFIDKDTWQGFAYTVDPQYSESGFSDHKVMASIRKLFYDNGYRAIKYKFAQWGWEEGWAVYDPSCITILRIKQSPGSSTAAQLLTH